MNTPAHLAAGGVVVQAVLFADARFGGRLPKALRPWARGIACVVFGAASHLALDALPHYNWIVYLRWLTDLPYHWLIRNAIFELVVFIPVIYWGRDRWMLVCLTACAAMYPDFEKVLYHDFQLPAQFVIFRGHSLQLSQFESELSHGVLITSELILIGIFLFGSWQLSSRRLSGVGSQSG